MENIISGDNYEYSLSINKKPSKPLARNSEKKPKIQICWKKTLLDLIRVLREKTKSWKNSAGEIFGGSQITKDGAFF